MADEGDLAPVPAKPEDEEILQSLPEEMKEAIEQLPEEQRKSLLVALEWERRTSYSGPIPPAEMLIAYGQAYDGCAKDIVDMAIRDQAHAHEMNTTIIRANIENDRERSRIGAGLIGIFMVGSFLLVLLGAPGAQILGGGGVVTSVLSLIGLYAKSERDKARLEQKSNQQEPPSN